MFGRSDNHIEMESRNYALYRWFENSCLKLFRRSDNSTKTGKTNYVSYRRFGYVICGTVTTLICLCLPLFLIGNSNLKYNIRIPMGFSYFFFFTVIATMCVQLNLKYIKLFVEKLCQISTYSCQVPRLKTSTEPTELYKQPIGVRLEGTLVIKPLYYNPRTADPRGELPLNNLQEKMPEIKIVRFVESNLAKF